MDYEYIISGGFDLSAPDWALKKVRRLSRTGEAETLPDLNVGRFLHACGQFVNNEGVSVSFIYIEL